MDADQQEPMEPMEPTQAQGSERSGKSMSRRDFVVGATVAGAAVAAALPSVGQARAWSPKARNRALASGLAPG